MKLPLYFKYTSRSLLRGGQRTILAIFCVAVGVMAVVSLQLVGFMLQSSLLSNVRVNNDGDIVLHAASSPLQPTDLAFFDQLKHNSTITNYSAIIETHGTLSATAPLAQSFPIEAVDSHNFPLVAQPQFVQPSTGRFANILVHNQVIVTQHFLKTTHQHLGDAFAIYTKTSTSSGQTLHVKLAGVITNTGMFSQANNLLLISTQDYLASAPAALHTYTSVHLTTADKAHTDAANKALNAHFPLAVTQTADEILKAEQSSLDTINKFLEITGLLALLIGGAGIVNTMQVLLARRTIEIAMLKTTGYRRRDLILLFGLETGLLGLTGGVVGAVAAIGMSVFVHSLIQQIGLSSAFSLNPQIIGGGVVIGTATALTFGLLPIVQAANVRPLHVVRHQEKPQVGNIALTGFLLALLSLLFCLLAASILKNDLVLGIETTYGTLVFLLLLSGFFSLVVLAISKLPIPEHFQAKQILLVLAGIVLSVPMFLLLPIFGIGLLVVSLFGLVVSFLPRSWKINLKMALRNLGRQRTRTMTTLLALFVGIFGIGLVLALGQDVQATISKTLAKDTPYNLVVTTSGQDTSTLHAQIHTIPGLSWSREDLLATLLPNAINGQPLSQVLSTGNDRQAALSLLSQIESYDPTQHGLTLTMSQGRLLNASDATTNNIIVSDFLTNPTWFHVKIQVGSTLTFTSTDSKTSKTATVVGILTRQSSNTILANVLAPVSFINALNQPGTEVKLTSPPKTVSAPTQQAQEPSPTTPTLSSVFYLNVAPAQVNTAQDALGRIVPNASIQNLNDAAASLIQQLKSMLDVLVALASLSMLAAIVIIANTVALAMLERRREMGILKSVGYTSRTVLSGVLIENGIVGAVGSFMATLLAAGGVTLIGSQIFNLTLRMSPLLVISLVGGSALLAMLIALLVAWGAVRVRPLEVLRYE